MSMETLQSIADPLRTGLMVAALVAFAAIVAWTFLRPRERIEADAQLWKDDEKGTVGRHARRKRRPIMIGGRLS